MERKGGGMKIEEVMTREPKAVPEATSLKDVARILAEHGISGLPVVDEEGKVVGVVSEADIVGKEVGAERERSLLGRLLRGGPPPVLDARTAGEAMTAPALTITADREVAEAARTMTEQGVNRLPVVDDEGRLVGIVTRADLVRAFLRSDEEIERELREEVVGRKLWIDPSELEISVENGEVALRGKVESRADAELLEYFATRVPGVVAVRSTLRWEVDEPKLPQSDPRIPEARG
ncbi:MAG: CBS domain-containing protein [Thermoleophilia bacterium]|nr:CBS domain-containing protein [Gaiellaceae bacterium]MDW8338063.1 CBS domain-containing protein [Thermoleophilia bacterium]